tara:strand:- start:1487 stop:1708 length:222 start_codon:yes stop_codon:yes gene_type:complete
MAFIGKHAKANTASIKVAPGSLGLGGGPSTPRQYRSAMAEHNAKQMVNNFIDNHNANIPKPPPKPKGDCGCGK